MSQGLSSSQAVTVIGAGAMGAGIAQIAAVAGHPVRLYDTRTGAAAQAIAGIANTLGKLADKGKISQQIREEAVAKLQAIDTLADAAGSALVVEAIVENLEVKRGLFKELAAIVADDCILASNTSSISLTAIAAGVPLPERVVGMHFFNPAPQMALVEVVSGLSTSQDVADSIYATASAWGKAPVHTTSSPGFIVNRVARPFYAEGLRLLHEQAASPATIDALLREAGGFRMGPFELMDLIGHDVNFAVTSSVFAAYFNDQRFLPSLIQQELVAAGHLGRKSGRGFYDYSANAIAPQAEQLAPAAKPASITVLGQLGPAEALVERLAASGITLNHAADTRFPDGALSIGDTLLALSDGRSATQRAAGTGCHNLVLFDLALDYSRCSRLALAKADQASDAALSAVAGALQAAGIACSQLDDIPGLAVMRTVCMIANEAADAVNQGVCTVAAADIAMQKGVNYPRGPLAWADQLGLPRVVQVLAHLAAHYGEDRYRCSPLLQRKVWAARKCHD